MRPSICCFKAAFLLVIFGKPGCFTTGLSDSSVLKSREHHVILLSDVLPPGAAPLGSTSRNLAENINSVSLEKSSLSSVNSSGDSVIGVSQSDINVKREEMIATQVPTNDSGDIDETTQHTLFWNRSDFAGLEVVRRHEDFTTNEAKVVDEAPSAATTVWSELELFDAGEDDSMSRQAVSFRSPDYLVSESLFSESQVQQYRDEGLAAQTTPNAYNAYVDLREPEVDGNDLWSEDIPSDGASSSSALPAMVSGEQHRKAVTDVGGGKVTTVSTGSQEDFSDYDIVVETLASTTTLSLVPETRTSHRVQRTIDENEIDVHSNYGTLISDQTSSFSTFMSVVTEPTATLKKENRMAEADPDIDDIIHGIMQLLGGNVKLGTSVKPSTLLTTFGDVLTRHVTSTRLNDRGPPRLPNFPFGLLPTAPAFNRPPIRRPITPPTDHPPGRPAFVANTRPPFLATLPPGLSRPLPGHNTRVGIPLPDVLMPPGEISSDSHSLSYTLPVSVVAMDTQVTTITTTEPAPFSTNIQETLNEHHSSSAVLSTAINATSNAEGSTTAEMTFPTTSSKTKVTFEDVTLEPSTDGSSATNTLSVSAATETLPTSTISETSKITQTANSSIRTISVTHHTETPSEEATMTPVLQASSLPPPSLPPPPPPLPSATSSSSPYTSPAMSVYARPGLVLEDTRYVPGNIITGTVLPDRGTSGEVFDITVSASHGFGGRPVGSGPPSAPYVSPVASYYPQQKRPAFVSTPVGGGDEFVSIDGRKTYFDLFQTQTMTPAGIGVVIPEEELPSGSKYYVAPPQTPQPIRTPPPLRPQVSVPSRIPPRPQAPKKPPPLRIDTCIVGDDSTCGEELGEVCRTEGDVSSCYCRPGTARQRPRTLCKRMASFFMSLKVDRVGDHRIVWNGNYGNPNSEEYRILEWEAHRAINNAMRKTKLASLYLGNRVLKFYSLGGKVIVNSTVMLQEAPVTKTRTIREAIQRQMIQVIQNHGNYIGSSPLAVDGPLNPIPEVKDVNECGDPKLHDCDAKAQCINEFGTFKCRCLPGYSDKSEKAFGLPGRKCESCSSDYCNQRGDCRIELGQKVCQCRGSYYGARCEIDGEVLGVAVGASVAAVVIIVLTLIFLCMWSRKWKAQDRKTELLSRRLPTFGHFSNMQSKNGGGHQRSYGVMMEDRIRWPPHLADQGANQNLYAQPEQLRAPSAGPTTSPFFPTNGQIPPTSSSGYASLGPMQGSGGSQFAQFPQTHFALPHLNPMGGQSYGAPSTYGQYSSNHSQAVSRAPTLGARTPVPLRDTHGGKSMGPAGGGSIAVNNYNGGADSSEEDMDRAYQLPRPKSRTSLGVGNFGANQGRLARSYNSLLF